MTQLSPADHPGAVRRRDADGYGLTRTQLETGRWVRLSRGLYAPRSPARAPEELARALAQVLPRDSGFGHLTSAARRGWWLPNRLGRHVTLATTTSGVHVQRRGLYVRRSRHGQFEHVGGVPVSTPEQTLVELARDLSLVDLVPMVDCALRDGADPDAILEAARPRLRGSRHLRDALSLADARSESWWESVLRLLHVLTGLGPVDCQVELWEGTAFVARADLHLVGTRRYPECDGGGHRDQGRHEADLRRDRRLTRLGHERYGYTPAEITRNPGLIIRDAEQARGWPHDPRRLDEWWRWARSSTLTPYGRSRLAAHLERYHLAAERHRRPEGRTQVRSHQPPGAPAATARTAAPATPCPAPAARTAPLSGPRSPPPPRPGRPR